MIIDAFAGCGGWDEGIRQTGYDGTLKGWDLFMAALNVLRLNQDGAWHVMYNA